MKITVFTATYNRGYILLKLYQSLRQQTVKNFEWIVVDDGSTDQTKELFESWQKENNAFPILYQKTENGGKCRAVNQGVALASAEAFFIVDSDDYLLPDTIEKVSAWFTDIRDDERFAGVSGLRGSSKQDPIGGFPRFDAAYVDCLYSERRKYGLLRDKAEIYKTEILKKYPFPVYENEKYVTPSIVWDAISGDGYKLRYFKEIIYICDYLEDGLTRTGYSKFVNSPQGTMAYIRKIEQIQGKEAADQRRFRFYFMLRTLYGGEKAGQMMALDENDAQRLAEMYTEMLDTMRAYFQREKIKKVAIYGLGNVGMAFLKVAERIPVEVVYGFDQKKVPVDAIPVYAEIDDYGEVDAVIITMRVCDEEVEKKLAKRFQKIAYWKDISARYWFDE